MASTRRDLLKVSAIGFGAGILGSLALPFFSSLKNSFENLLNQYNLKFTVNIYNDKEEAKIHISKDLSYLAEDGSYLEISVNGKNIYDECRVFENYNELPVHHDRFYSRRFTGKMDFQLIVTSPSLKGTEKFTFQQGFMNNKELLDKIINSYFNGSNEVSFLREIYYEKEFPSDLTFNPERSNIIYEIYGLEALTDRDKGRLEKYIEHKKFNITSV